MADPNRKINLDLPSDDDSDEAYVELDPSEISLVKEFEDCFKSRFTEEDKVFSDFCNTKAKPPPIVYPFDNNQHRGGHRGGRFQGYGNRPHYDNRRNNYDGRRYNNNHRNHHHDHNQQQYKRPRMDPNQSGGS